MVLLSVFAQAQQDVAKGSFAADSAMFDPGVGLLNTDSAFPSNDSLSQPLSSSADPKKETLDDRIEYTSTDSMVIMGNGIAHMYGSGELQYKAMKLTAEYIRMHMDRGCMILSKMKWWGSQCLVRVMIAMRRVR